MASYQFIDEPRGGVGMEVIAADPFALYNAVATSLCLYIWDQESVQEFESVELSWYGFDYGTTALGLLSEMLFRMENDDWVFKRFETDSLVEVDDPTRKKGKQQWKITGRAFGERLDPKRHQIRFPVEAVLLPKLRFKEQEDGQWRFYCILDA